MIFPPEHGVTQSMSTPGASADIEEWVAFTRDLDRVRLLRAEVRIDEPYVHDVDDRKVEAGLVIYPTNLFFARSVLENR